MLGTYAIFCRSRAAKSQKFILRNASCKKPCKPKAPKKVEQQVVDDCKKCAIILAGCGHLDGSEIHETAALAVSLTRNEILPKFYAPEIGQSCVVDHYKRCPVSESRCVLPEAARLARSKIKPLSELRHCDANCLIVPGGFGVAQTLSTFQKERENCTIHPEVMRVLEEFHDVKKPMGFMCIAAVLPAKMFPCVKITLGMKGKPDEWPFQDAIEAATEMGAEVEMRKVDEFSFDKQHMVFSTPAFMYDGLYFEIFDGIARMIENMCQYLE